MFNNSTVVILIVVAFVFYLIYSQNQQKILQLQQQPMRTHLLQAPCPPCQKCEYNKYQNQQFPPQSPTNNREPFEQIPNTRGAGSRAPGYPPLTDRVTQPPNITNVVIDSDADPYSDPVKKQDLYSMYDPLTYPQLRLPREVLQKYNEYYERNGVYPPFNQATQPLFDNPVLNGILIKQCEENEPFYDNVPSSVPLFRVSSARNTNRYFYYIVDQRYLSKLELKIPLDHVKLNGVRYNNADFYGLPEIFDGDIIDHIPIYPGTKFKVLLYKTYHFP